MKKLCLSVLIIFVLFFNACTKKNSDLKTDEIRIVSLSPSITETVFAIGAGELLYGRTDFCNYPEEALQIESVGGFDGKTLSLEKIIALKPTIVLGVYAMHDFMENALKASGIPLYLSRVNTIEDVYNEILYVGQISGYLQGAQELVSQMKEKITKVQSYTEKKSAVKKVYWEVDSSPYISVGNKTYINERINIATGGQNIFSDLNSEYPVVSEETIIARNPDVIIMPVYTKEEMTGFDNNIHFQRKNWENVLAVKNDSVYRIFSDYISRTGPRIVLGIELIARFATGYECTLDEE